MHPQNVLMCEWLGSDAFQASHQPAVLYPQALHFVRDPLQNMSGVEWGREEERSHFGRTHCCQHSLSAITQTRAVYFGKLTMFLFPRILLLMV